MRGHLVGFWTHGVLGGIPETRYNLHQTSLDNLRRRLQNKYSKTNIFIENVDYVKVRAGKTSGTLYMVNYQCFERIAMSGDTPQSDVVRSYFVKLREFIMDNQELIFQAMENNTDLSMFRGYDSIYFFAVDERKNNLFKVGRTRDIVQRLRNYNIGRIREVDLKYFALVKNPLLIEKCIGLKLSRHRVVQNREIFSVDPKKLKKIIDDCYCKHVSGKQNDELYGEIADLLGLYAYTKDKVNIKPYVIIK